jgi:hypothetical protein
MPCFLFSVLLRYALWVCLAWCCSFFVSFLLHMAPTPKPKQKTAAQDTNTHMYCCGGVSCALCGVWAVGLCCGVPTTCTWLGTRVGRSMHRSQFGPQHNQRPTDDTLTLPDHNQDETPPTRPYGLTCRIDDPPEMRPTFMVLARSAWS